jgi:hypothetical protein
MHTARIKHALQIFRSDISNLTQRTAIERESARRQLGNDDLVTDAIVKAEKDMRRVMDSLTWWRAVWRVDELGAIVTYAVENAWCKDLERHVRTSPPRRYLCQLRPT